MGAKLKYAPVYFCIGQIQHNPLLSLESYLPTIQERMRKAGYPGYKRSVQVAFKLNNAESSVPAPSERVDLYGFSNVPDTAGFVMTSNALSFQTTDYYNYEKFWSELKAGLEVVHESVGGLSFVDRLGIRYLDAVVPKDGEALSDYLAPHLLGLPACVPEASFAYSFSEALLVADGGSRVTSRTIIQNGEIGFPPDLQPLGLKVSESLSVAQGEHAIIDTDASISERQPFDMSTIETHLDRLHSLASDCFKASITPHATGAWSGVAEEE